MGEAEAAAHGVEKSVFKIGDEVLEYAPALIGGVAGFVAGPGLIGGNALWGAINSGVGDSTVAPTRVVGAILGFITLVIGGALWSWGSRSGAGMWEKAIGCFVGGFFIGTGLSYILRQTVGNQPIGPGLNLLDSLTTKVTTAAGGG